MNRCTNCTNLTFTSPKVTFTPPEVTFRVPQVHLLSASPGQADRCGCGRSPPGRKVCRAGRDRGRSRAGVCGTLPPDRGWDNRAGQVRYAHRYGLQKSSYLTFMFYISPKVAINHDTIKYIHTNNRQKPTLIYHNRTKPTDSHCRGAIFVLLSPTP